jgi:hypothetical protein
MKGKDAVFVLLWRFELGKLWLGFGLSIRKNFLSMKQLLLEQEIPFRC